MADNIQEPVPYATETISPVEQPIIPVTAEPVPAPPAPTTTTTTTASVSDTPQKVEDVSSLYIKQRLVSLVYWEKPYCSGTVLATLLGVLVLTHYYSVLQLAAGFFTIVTGINLVYVNAHKQGQRMFSGKANDQLTNPHSQRFKSTYIPRERVVRAAQLAVDAVEAAVQQVTSLVLIENSCRSAWAVGIAYLVWTVSTYVSTKYLVGMFIVGAFSVPRIYSQNQELIDSQVAQYSAQGRAIAEQYGSVASAKAKELYEQAMNVVSKKKTA